MVIEGLARTMFNITDGPLWWSCTWLPPFIGFYLYLTLKTADKVQRLCFHSFDRQKSNIPWPKHTETFIFTICSHCQPQLPALLIFYHTAVFKVKDPLRSSSTNHQNSCFGQKNVTPVSARLMFKKCREHVERSAGGQHVAESRWNS